MTATRIPPNFFGFAFGLAGLSETWAIAAHDGRAPRAVATALAVAAGVVWLVVLASYLRYVAYDHSTLKRDLEDPVVGPFLSLAVIAPMVWSVVGISPFSVGTAKVVFDVFVVATVILGGWFTGQWIYGSLDLNKLHPGYFLPTVAGGLVASDGAALLGQHTLAEVTFGFGVISWLIMGSMILGRLFFGPTLATPLLPTIAIEVAPAAVASLAWFDGHGDRIDIVAAFLAGYGLLMIIAQFRLLPTFVRLPFMPSTWAFTFSWAAVASAGLHWLNDAHPAGHTAYEDLLLAAISLFIGGIAVRTVVAIGRRQLLPAAPAAATIKQEATPVTA
jgi:tellurite resistance protein